ncbi:MAG: rRNA (cytosine967-C5)-methyltransferase, partial [Thermoleophilaceae bacterium]|nr:rRNA (cytosine967-C5)-methyltransferase [Thermoleophilaceae bacterium]
QVRPGGVLVYSTCTISARENEERMQAFLSEHTDFRRDRVVQLLPHRDGTDGFFIARLERGS